MLLAEPFACSSQPCADVGGTARRSSNLHPRVRTNPPAYYKVITSPWPPARGPCGRPPSPSQAVPHGIPHLTQARMRALLRGTPGSDAGLHASSWRGEGQSANHALRFAWRPAGEAPEARDSQATLRSDAGGSRRWNGLALTGREGKSRVAVVLRKAVFMQCGGACAPRRALRRSRE